MHLSLRHQNCVTTVQEVKISKYFKQHVCVFIKRSMTLQLRELKYVKSYKHSRSNYGIYSLYYFYI